MPRQELVIKWLSYGILLALIALLQGLVFTRLRLWGTIPMLLPLGLSALAVLEGPESGAGYGIAVGIVSMYVNGGGPVWVVLSCAIGITIGLITRYVLRQGLWGHCLCCAGVLLLHLLWAVVFRWITGVAPFGVLLSVGLPEFFWSLLLAPAVYYLYRFVYKRWGSAYYA